MERNYTTNIVPAGFQGSDYRFTVLQHKMGNMTRLGNFSVKVVLPLNTGVEFIITPKLTKIAVAFINASLAFTIVAKRVDYSQGIIIDMNFQDLPGFMQTVRNAATGATINFAV